MCEGGFTVNLQKDHGGEPRWPVTAPLAAAAFDYKKVLSICEACRAVKMPVIDRALILDGAYYRNLFGDGCAREGLVRRFARASPPRYEAREPGVGEPMNSPPRRFRPGGDGSRLS